jgi:hypothetical protein
MGEGRVQNDNRVSRSVRGDAEIADGMDAKDGKQKSNPYWLSRIFIYCVEFPSSQ